MRRRTRTSPAIAVLAALLGTAATARAQQINLGHKLPGTLGLQAGVVPPAGLYVQDAFLVFLADRAIDRNGNTVLRGLDLRVIADQVGIGVSFEIKPIKALYGMAVGVPFARIRADAIPPQLNVDRDGLGDIYVRPMQLGFRTPHADLLASYAFYVPTGRFEFGPRGGVSSGQWTFEYSLGGTLYFDSDKKWRLTALASYDNYGPKNRGDIIRGDIVQLQGGLGVELFRVLTVGLDSYSLWQVRDNGGADLPAALRGARDQAFGMGPELLLKIPPLRTQMAFRWEHDIRVRSRPLGQVFLVSLAVKAW